MGKMAHFLKSGWLQLYVMETVNSTKNCCVEQFLASQHVTLLKILTKKNGAHRGVKRIVR